MILDFGPDSVNGETRTESCEKGQQQAEKGHKSGQKETRGRHGEGCSYVSLLILCTVFSHVNAPL